MSLIVNILFDFVKAIQLLIFLFYIFLYDFLNIYFRRAFKQIINKKYQNIG